MNPIKTASDRLKELYFDIENKTIIDIVVFLVLLAIDLVVLFVLLSDFERILIGVQIPRAALYYLTFSISYSIWVIVTFRRIRDDRRELIARTNFVASVVQKYDPKYIIENFNEVHEILKNGDGIFKREVDLAYDGENVPWYEMHMGSTNNIPLEKKIEFSTINPKTNQKLAKIPYQVIGSKAFYAIILDPVLDSTTRLTYLEIRRPRWKAIWANLMNKNTRSDNGTINLKFPAIRLSLRFIVPKPFELYNYVMTPAIPTGTWSVSRDHRDNYCLTFTAQNVAPKQYQYSFQSKEVQI